MEDALDGRSMHAGTPRCGAAAGAHTPGETTTMTSNQNSPTLGPPFRDRVPSFILYAARPATIANHI